MNINKVFQKIKPHENEIVLVLVVVFVGLIAFGLGRLSALSERKTPIGVGEMMEVEPPSLKNGAAEGEKLFVASKNGTKYHYPWCAGAQSIKEENKIWFFSKEEAEAAGYSPAANCKGL